MVAEDFLQDQQVRQWLNGVEPAWNAIRIANDLSSDEIAGSAVTRNTFILLRQAIEGSGLPLTAPQAICRGLWWHIVKPPVHVGLGPRGWA
jgi:hypothetical protein